MMLTVYVLMSVWLLVSAALRIDIQLSSGLPLDPLPFISGGIGLLALVLLLPTLDEWRNARQNPPEPPTAPGALPDRERRG
ncbi:hypothetical protein D1781_03345 [Amnibacterium setariae]|uniref:Uncharacterized protein n=1 Tax=Amnibacterium setariae TaxID=2306585 RepID=A0A3A1U4V0_9MICO|nr:hypothetical protein D1781_03345 [Amnibacterium setariae]